VSAWMQWRIHICGRCDSRSNEVGNIVHKQLPFQFKFLFLNGWYFINNKEDIYRHHIWVVWIYKSLVHDVQRRPSSRLSPCSRWSCDVSQSHPGKTLWSACDSFRGHISGLVLNNFEMKKFGNNICKERVYTDDHGLSSRRHQRRNGDQSPIHMGDRTHATSRIGVPHQHRFQ
jgi:hypothetical protein